MEGNDIAALKQFVKAHLFIAFRAFVPRGGKVYHVGAEGRGNFSNLPADVPHPHNSISHTIQLVKGDVQAAEVFLVGVGPAFNEFIGVPQVLHQLEEHGKGVLGD